MRLVTTGTTPQRAQTWNAAVRVPKAYADTASASRTVMRSAPAGWAVHTPPCFMQNEQVQARAGISVGSGCQVSTKEMFPQWQLPRINIASCYDVDSWLAFGHFHAVRPLVKVLILVALAASGVACHRDACVPTCERRAQELGCSQNAKCQSSCQALHASPVCVPEFKGFEACLLREPKERWQCDDEGMPAIRPEACDQERQRLTACMQKQPPPAPPPARTP
jgi:hypothetical protein